MAEATDKDDPIVAEVDVYLNQQLLHQLFLLQYSVRPAHMTYDDTTFLSAKFKPENHCLEMEMHLNTQSDNYSHSKGEQIALNVDGSSLQRSSGEKQSYYASNKMDKQVLTSCPSGVNTSRYAVGCMRDGSLHLNYMESVLKILPSFEYLDKADKRSKATQDQDSETMDGDQEIKAVKVKFARKESDFAKARRVASFEYMSEQIQRENWVNINHYPIDDPSTNSKRGLLAAQEVEQTGQFCMKEQDFFKKVLPAQVTETVGKLPSPSNVLSLAQLRTMPLSKQMEAIMKNTKVLRFSRLYSLIQKDNAVPESDWIKILVRTVQEVAMLVQGCWVVKSEILYPTESFSPHSGVPAKSLVRGRNYIMWRFTRSQYVVREEVRSVVKLPNEDVYDILDQMAFRPKGSSKPQRAWKFCMQYDAEFANSQPQIVQRQSLLWDKMFQEFSQTLKLPQSDLDRRYKQPEMMSPERPRRRRNSSRTKSCSERSGSDTDNEYVKQDRHRRASGTGSPRSRHHSKEEIGSGTHNIAEAKAIAAATVIATDKLDASAGVLVQNGLGNIIAAGNGAPTGAKVKKK